MTETGERWSRRRWLAAAANSLAVGLVPGLGAAQPERGAWQRGVPLPHPVQEIYPALLRGAIHVAGGFEARAGALGPTRAHWRYDPGDGRWSERAPLPEARHHPNLVGADGGLFALGGFTARDAGTWIMRRQTWRYDAETEAWSPRAPAPERHAETVSAALDGRIHVVGGRVPAGERNAVWPDHVDSDRHLVYEPERDAWQQAAPCPAPRNSAAGAVIEGRLYVVGGRTVGGGNVAATHVYEPREDRWRTAAPMPQAQGGLAAAALGGQLYAFGGEFAGPAGSGVYAESWRYDPAADRWAPAPAMPTPRHGLGAVTLGDSIYVVGGATRAGAAGTSAAGERFRPGR